MFTGSILIILRLDLDSKLSMNLYSLELVHVEVIFTYVDPITTLEGRTSTKKVCYNFGILIALIGRN